MRPLITADMFTRPLLPVLREAIDVVTNDDTVSGEDRLGKKVNLHNTIKRATKILKGMYAESMEDAKVVEMDNFMVAYNFRAPEKYMRRPSTKLSLSPWTKPVDPPPFPTKQMSQS